jgi:Xaa-Pro aminopeptidase
VNELDRVARVARELREREIDRLLVTAPVNLRYLTGFTGSNGLALIAASPERRQLFFTDFRYATQSAEQVPDEFERWPIDDPAVCPEWGIDRRSVAPAELLQDVAHALGPGGVEGERRLGFDDASLTVKQHARLRELLARGWELVPCAGAVERLREVKDEREIAAIRAAAEVADEALTGVLEAGVVGRTERELAIELELRMRRLGAQAPSFPSIVASGEHGALPHAEPRDVQIARGVLVTIDWGASLDGYCSDCTRTYATGPLAEEATATYELVLRAQEAALDAVRAGIGGREVDGAARAVIDEAGRAENFGHGVGHGVGMEIHEAPRLSRTAPDRPLRAGNVVTVEPGVYLPGRLGVRIEDLVVVREGGSERLTSLPKGLTTVE